MTGAWDWLTTGAFNHGAPRWMPDGKSLVFSGLRVSDAEYRWRESDVYKIDVASGSISQLTTRKGPDNNPTPSPDGRWLAVVGVDEDSANPAVIIKGGERIEGDLIVGADGELICPFERTM